MALSVRRLFAQIQRCRPILAPHQTARCVSQAAAQPAPSADENEAVNPNFVNRNPRNLEQMALAVKDRGWKTTWPHREFYHRYMRWCGHVQLAPGRTQDKAEGLYLWPGLGTRVPQEEQDVVSGDWEVWSALLYPDMRLEFSRTQHHVTAHVFSSSSSVPVLSCSTKEWALKRELASTNCVAACQAVGEVLAQRCHQAGITRMVYKAIPWTYRSDAVQSFRAAMKDGGITLSEPRRKYIGT